jgi:hypothetical protein
MEIKERALARFEAALFTGWFAERFARESQLQGPQHYLAEFTGEQDSPAIQQATAEAELARMALTWGLDLEDVEQDD